jgi:hypothetical protein
MNNQSPWQQAFNLSSGAANQLGRGQQMASDTRSLDELINEAKSSGDTSKLEKILGSIEDPQKREQGVKLIKEKMAKTETRSQSIKDYQKLIDLGFNPEEAKQYSQILANIPVGAQTETWKQIFDIKKRMPKQAGANSQNPLPQDANPEQPGYQEPDIDNFEGATPAERIRGEAELRKLNMPIWEASKNSLKLAKSESDALSLLDRLDATGKLPEGIGRLNIMPQSGELIFPAGANAETQLYLKTINDFTTKAKDTYGGRVTNFELERFMKRLPGLANTKEGRALITKVMRNFSKRNELQHKTLVDIYREKGTHKIDPVQAEYLAERRMQVEMDKLKSEFDSIIPEEEKTSENPPAGSFRGELNGQPGFIPDTNKEEFLKMGGKIL